MIAQVSSVPQETFSESQAADRVSHDIERARSLAAERWPADDLENVARCPVCAGDERRILYKDLVDWTFLNAPGRWTLWECANCHCGYLDPRPTSSSIGRAYASYYTHNPKADHARAEATLGNRGFFGRVRQASATRFREALINGYRNRRFNTRTRPFLRVGYWVVKRTPNLMHQLDWSHRYLPKAQPGDRLLDYGCGNGGFLAHAHEAGWEVLGIDPDPTASVAAAKSGLKVLTGGEELLSDFHGEFAAVTLSHVLEHTPDPVATLRQIYTSLKVGGFIYIEVPNLGSPGREHFGPYWRGLEIPRHLVHFRADALRKLLEDAGFRNILQKDNLVGTGIWMFGKSCEVRSTAGESGSVSPAEEWAALAPAYKSTREGEFLTFVACK